MKRTQLILTAILSVSLFAGCKTATPSGTPSAASSAENADFTREQARERKARLEKIHYQLTVRQNEKDETFSGVNVISFQLKNAEKPLRLDFFEGQVSVLKVNGADVPLSAKKTYWIELPASALKPGANIVEVHYTAAYTRQGLGLHRFVDPETKDIFTYTKLEPHEANRVFPCFDQPDLRSTWELTAEVPARWQVISTTKEVDVRDAGPGRKMWKFPLTPSISTYLFSMHAGPYQVWSDKYQNIPLRIFARPSMAKYVRHKEWFGWTKKGLKFYENYFGYKYPFKKYDQIMVPEASGAMENVASVTFTEALLPRAEPTRAQSRVEANVLLHEMAHMWFGDVVTMTWWNDLWLNESFATYMASLALAQATEFKESWQDFFVGEKEWAYWEDGLVTTHPIEAPVTSVKEGLANFDGITYGKGAAVVKQLRAYIGPDAFDRGIRHYIRTHSFQNTQLTDFIAALQTQTKKDLSAWADVWLRQSGTDKVQASWSCDGGKLGKITVEMQPAAGARFRPQHFELGLFRLENGKVTKPVVVPVDLTQPKVELTGSWSCPAFVYPNVGDHGYMAVKLDPESLKFATSHLSGVQDELTRNMLWHDLWDMVRAGDMPLKTYISIAESQFPKENNVLVLDKIVETISARSSCVLNYWPQNTPESKAKRDQFIAQMEREYLRRLNQAKPGSDPQKFWLDEYVRLARTPEGLGQLKTWLNGKAKIPGLQLDIDRRWNMARQIARFEPKDAPPFIEALKKEDSSDRGRRNLMATEAVQPDPSVKEKWVQSLSRTKPDLSLAEARAVMFNLFPPEQSELSKRFDEPIFNYLRANAKAENEVYLRTYAMGLSPLNCEAGRAARFKKFLESENFTLAVSKPLRINLQEDERCQVVRSKSQL